MGAVRVNGFETPRHPLQICSWVLFAVLVAGFYALQIPFLPTLWAVLISIVYGVTAACVAYSTYRCTVVDPKDPVLNNECDSALAATEGRVYCNLCRDDVQKKSKHCRLCNKCVEVFDHHCHWLNTCVGKRNYSYFLSILASTLALTLLHLLVCIYLIVDYYALSSGSADTYRGWRRGVDYLGCSVDSAKCVAFVSVQIAYAVLLVPVVGLIAQLALFHVTLVRQKMTTYDFIVMQVKKEREREMAGIDDSFFGQMKQCMECNCAPKCVKTKGPRGRGRGRGRGQGQGKNMLKGGGARTMPASDAPMAVKGSSKAVTPESSPKGPPPLVDEEALEEGSMVHSEESEAPAVSRSAPPPEAVEPTQLALVNKSEDGSDNGVV
jgi:palmitoyltransferase